MSWFLTICICSVACNALQNSSNCLFDFFNKRSINFLVAAASSECACNQICDQIDLNIYCIHLLNPDKHGLIYESERLTMISSL